MSATPDTPAFQPYACSLGTVLDHGDGTIYRIELPTGQVIAIPANGTPSEDAVEFDIANPPAPPAAPLRQSTDIVVDRLTDAEIDALTAPTAPTVARRAWLAATSTGLISQADPRFASLTAALDAAGIIAANRWPALLAAS
jgi:hypothetical protein